MKVAADAMKELEMFLPSVSGTDPKTSRSRSDPSFESPIKQRDRVGIGLLKLAL